MSDVDKLIESYTETLDSGHRTAAPATSRSTETTYRAELTWAVGEGPVVPIPYRDKLGQITAARVSVTVDGDGPGRSFYRVGGVVLKVDGTPAKGQWGESYSAAVQALPDEYRQQLDALILMEREGES